MRLHNNKRTECACITKTHHKRPIRIGFQKIIYICRKYLPNENQNIDNHNIMFFINLIGLGAGYSCVFSPRRVY